MQERDYLPTMDPLLSYDGSWCTSFLINACSRTDHLTTIL